MRHLVSTAAMLAAAALAAAPAAARPPAPPKLIVAIAVDQFSGDLFNEYRPHFSAGLKRLTEGAVFPRGYQSHAATETCPGHSTILTGSRPARTGIIANNWFDLDAPRADKKVYCAEDEREPGTDSDNYVASPIKLRVPTLGGRMKAANPAARVLSVSGKDRAAIMMGGPTADQTWWWGGKGFRGYRNVTETPLIARVNAGVSTLIAQDRPPMELPPHCAAKDFPVAVGKRTFGTHRFARAANDHRAFRASPEMDAATLVLAASLIEEMALGGQAQTDIISIGLSATDTIGHSYGTEGVESCLQIDRLDRELGAFFDRLDRDGIDYVVVLTADHGGHDLPERHRENAMPMKQRVDAALTPTALNAALSRRTGLAAPLLYGDAPFGDIYMAKALTPAQRARVAREALAFWHAHPQVEAVFTHDQLAAQPAPSGLPENWTLLQAARAGFVPDRSGDFVVLLKSSVTPIVQAESGYVATHGSPWDFDRRVPILFWRKGMRGFEQPMGIETADIMPTLAALIGLPVPSQEIDGRCLDLIAGEGDSCGN